MLDVGRRDSGERGDGADFTGFSPIAAYVELAFINHGLAAGLPCVLVDNESLWLKVAEELRRALNAGPHVPRAMTIQFSANVMMRYQRSTQNILAMFVHCHPCLLF